MTKGSEGVVNSGRFMFEPLEHPIYKVVGHMAPGLNLDVGAAACMYSRLMALLSPQSRIIAFEPFPGNWQFGEKTVAPYPNITLRKEAVSDKDSSVKFFVSQTVTKDIPGWDKMEGYSSAGKIVTEKDPTAKNAIEVPAVRLDSVVDEPVRFCKIDVQGGEHAVLLGAERLIRKHGVDVFYIEFGGELEIIELLADSDYVFFDTHYLIIVNRQEPSSATWHIERPVALSTGAKAFFGWPLEAPRKYSAYCTWLQEENKKIGGVYSDIVAVRRSALPAFLAAAGAALAEAAKG